MQFSLIIRTRPQDTVRWQQALRFAETATQMGHSIRQCFFQSEGVLARRTRKLMKTGVALRSRPAPKCCCAARAAEAYEITANDPFVIGGLGA